MNLNEFKEKTRNALEEAKTFATTKKGILLALTLTIVQIPLLAGLGNFFLFTSTVGGSPLFQNAEGLELIVGAVLTVVLLSLSLQTIIQLKFLSNGRKIEDKKKKAKHVGLVLILLIILSALAIAPIYQLQVLKFEEKASVFNQAENLQTWENKGNIQANTFLAAFVEGTKTFGRPVLPLFALSSPSCVLGGFKCVEPIDFGIVLFSSLAILVVSLVFLFALQDVWLGGKTAREAFWQGVENCRKRFVEVLGVYAVSSVAFMAIVAFFSLFSLVIPIIPTLLGNAFAFVFVFAFQTNYYLKNFNA